MENMNFNPPHKQGHGDVFQCQINHDGLISGLLTFWMNSHNGGIDALGPRGPATIFHYTYKYYEHYSKGTTHQTTELRTETNNTLEVLALILKDIIEKRKRQ